MEIKCDHENVKIPIELGHHVEEVAKEIHNTWVQWRVASGFQYSETQDYEKKLHPHVRPWSKLPPDHRESDILAAKAAMKTLIGRKVIPSKRSGSHKVAATCGCYDVLHDGHIQQLIACYCMADEVVVFLNSDESIKRIKGEHKPVMPLQTRLALLNAVKFVDSVIVFHEDTVDKALQHFFDSRPDVGCGNFFWLKPAWDYAKQGVTEREIIQKRGGIVLYYDSPVPERSSSDIIQRIKEGVSVLDF